MSDGQSTADAAAAHEPAAAPSLLDRLRRRKLAQWALAYAAGAWVALQVLGFLAGAYEWSPAVLRVATGVALAGFLVAIVLAWHHGERGQQRVTPVEVLLVATIVVLSAAVMWRIEQRVAPGAASATTAPAAVADRQSIAVLPFADLSAEHDQEYFSDGIAEEILDALAKVDGLKVAGRTSSFHFKGRNDDLREIGRALGVAHVLEGSVRKQGNKVRISAQLVQVADGFHVWSESYDGELTDVFDLQERIARAITGKLAVVLHGAAQARIVPAATADPQAYALYLQATQALNRRDYALMGQAIGWLDEALVRDPAFARGHMRLAMIHALGQARYGADLENATAHARRALELDPSLAQAHAALALVARRERRIVDARVAIDRALELAPEDAEVNLYVAQDLLLAGYTRQGIARLERTLAIDPMLPNAVNWRAQEHYVAGELDAAEREFRRAGDLGLTIADVGLALVADERGDYARARTLVGGWQRRNRELYACIHDVDTDTAIDQLMRGFYGGDAAERATASRLLESCIATHPAIVPVFVPAGYMRLHDPERALATIEPGPTSDEATLFLRLWGPIGRETRRAPGFGALARKIGLAALWDRYGAPDACRTGGDGEYVCE